MKRTTLVFILAMAVAAPLHAAAPATMRVDYYHTGNDKDESFSLDRVVVEPLPWPGNPAKNVDTTESRQVFLRGGRRRERHGAVLARLRVHLRRVGDDRRSASR